MKVNTVSLKKATVRDFQDQYWEFRNLHPWFQ